MPEVQFGDGVAGNLQDVLTERNISKPLIVTDRGIEAAGILESITNCLSTPVETYFASTEPSTVDFDDMPTESVDGIVALGGGSCIDSAKVAAILMTYGSRPEEYLGVDHVPGPTRPLIAVPTTSGTGSQATQTAVISHGGVKLGISDEHLKPDVALVDPSLTFGLPRCVTAHSGFDAFVHALESLVARDYRRIAPRPITYQGANPVSRSLSWRALTLIYGSLERAVFDGDDREARRAMSLGSHLAGTAFSISGLGATHALASTVGGLTDRPHGACLASSLRAGLIYNLPVRRNQYATIARKLEINREGSDEDSAAAFLAECFRLRDSLGLPQSFADVGLFRSDVDVIVENTLYQERRLETNPRAVTEDLRDTLLDIEWNN